MLIIWNLDSLVFQCVLSCRLQRCCRRNLGLAWTRLPWCKLGFYLCAI